MKREKRERRGEIREEGRKGGERKKEESVDTLKRQTPRQHFNWSGRYLNLSTLSKDKSQIG